MFSSTRVLLIAIMKLGTIRSIIAVKHAVSVVSCKPLWVFIKTLTGFIKKLSYKTSCRDA